MTKNQILILVILVLLVGGVLYFAGNRNDQYIPEDSINNNNETTEDIFIERPVEGNKDDLVSFSVLPNQEVSGVLNFNGVIKNAYFFEANIGINILDENKKVLKRGNAMATGEWMTSGPVAFAGTIDLTGLPTGLGYIQIANDNASGLPENDKFIYIPVLIGE